MPEAGVAEAVFEFAGPGIHVIATDVDVDDAAELLTRLEVPVGPVIEGDLALSPFQDAAENLFLGHEPRRFGLVDRGRMRREAAEVFARFGLDLRPDGPPEVRPDQRLLFALARLAVRKVDDCVVDADRLADCDDVTLGQLARLAVTGWRILVVGARVGRFLGVARSVSAVSGAGGVVVWAEKPMPGVNAVERIASLFLDDATSRRLWGDDPGAETPARDSRQTSRRARPLLAVEGWTVPALPGVSAPVAHDVSFALGAGEIVAATGPGSREAIASLFGGSMGAPSAGRVLVRRAPDAAVVDVSTAAPDAAIAAGLAYGTEHPVAYDISLLGGIPTSVSGAALKRMAAAGVVDGRRSYRRARPSPLSALTARADDPRAFTNVLRGWAERGPSVVILDDPLRSDGEARASAIRAIAARGAAVLIVSGWPATMAGLVERAVVMRPGAPTREIPEADGVTAAFASAASAYRALVVARLSA